MVSYSGFSKLNRAERISYLIEHSDFSKSEIESLYAYDSPEKAQQKLFEEMIENYAGNFPIPMGLVPNMVINGTSYVVPFATEESSVIAAAAKAAKYWAEKGGFTATVQSVTKKGQIHFCWRGEPSKILTLFPDLKIKLLQSTERLTNRMRQRGGGITDIRLLDLSNKLPNYYQIDVSFETADAMGANFINSCLESMATCLKTTPELNTGGIQPEIIMSILSNYTPDCLVCCHVEAPIELLSGWNRQMSPKTFAHKFKQAVDIAGVDISRAVTHNKGIFNGIDAVLLSTGNDWRATAAAGHAYASRNGSYQGLTNLSLDNQIFNYSLELPLAVGTVGGITRMHPLVKDVSAMLNHPDAQTLMMIAAAAGLANNFAAIASLITSGIQEGHMKMHRSNMLSQLEASEEEKEIIRTEFKSDPADFGKLEALIMKIRSRK